jgi:ribosomal subunit interface protein
MTMTVHIVYRDIEPSDAIDTHIRRHIERLESHVSGIVSCHVAVEAPHRRKQHGRHYRVRIDLAIPGSELAVDRSPDDHRQHEDAYVAIDDAFDHALRRASEHARRWRSLSR